MLLLRLLRRPFFWIIALVIAIFALAPAYGNNVELRESLFSVRELMDDAVMLLREKARGHVSLELCLSTPIHVVADRRLTKQILINLLSNAIKFAPKGGVITVGAQEIPHNGIEIHVTDTGIGMTPAQIEKAFSLYGQVDSRLARAHEGTGLGLPISQSLARLQGGDLIAKSAPGKGTRMTLILPESRVARAAQALTSVG